MIDEQYPTPNSDLVRSGEQLRQHEFELSRERILVGLLEHQVIPDGDPNYPTEPHSVLRCRREFRTMGGDTMEARGSNFVPSVGESRWTWRLVVERVGSGSVFLYVDSDPLNRKELRVQQYLSGPEGNAEISLKSTEISGLIVTVATMEPIGRTIYETVA